MRSQVRFLLAPRSAMANASLQQLASALVRRKTTLLVFALIAIPGTPYLAISGIPLLGKIEATLFCLIACTLLSQRKFVKDESTVRKSNTTHSQASQIILLTLISVKLITFFAFPLQNGFEACYKSLYNAEIGCEKSYNNPFFGNDDVNQIGDISRIEKSLNFRSTNKNVLAETGASNSNWNLPFANEYPRFADLWLDRLPFEANFAGVVDTEEGGFIPIEFNGEITVQTTNSSYRGTSYKEFRQIIIPVDVGRTNLRIEYRYTDDERTSIPDEKPNPKGPYAHLVIGEVVQRISQIDQELSISGWVVDSEQNRGVTSIELQTPMGEIVAYSKNMLRADVNSTFLVSPETLTGYQFRTPIPKGFEDNKYKIVVTRENGKQETISDVYVSRNGAIFKEAVVKERPSSRLLSSVDYIDVSFSRSIETLETERTVPPSSFWRIFFNLLDISQIVIGLALLLIAVLQNAQKVRRGLIFAGASVGWILTTSITENILNVDLHTLQLAGVVLCAGIYFIKNVNGLLVGLSISFSTLLFGGLMKTLRDQHGLGEAKWWGFQIFRTRDSDWFVYQGYARQIFKSGSLQGGENTFYFMPGMRYLVYISHLVFGENDVFIALLGGIGFPAALIALVLLMNRNISPQHQPIGIVMVVALSIYLAHGTIVDLSMYTAAEIPAWLLIVFGCGLVFRVDLNPQQQLFGLSLLGLAANLRPNYSVVIVWLFVVAIIATLIELKPTVDFFIRTTRMALVFSLTFFLSFFHNMWYGLERTVFTNIADPKQTDFPPRELFGFFSNSEIQKLVVKKFSQALQWDQFATNTQLFVVVVVVQLCWVIGVGNLLIFGKNRSITILFAATPLILLVSYMPFSYTWIPLRHFFMVFLVLIISYLVPAGIHNSARYRSLNEYNDADPIHSGQLTEGK